MHGAAIVVCGAPGAGKTLLASLLAEGSPDFRRCSTDALREDLQLPPGDSAATRIAYKALAQLTLKTISESAIPVLDATFFRREYRDLVKSACAAHVKHWLILIALCEKQVCARRVSERNKGSLEEGVRGPSAFDDVLRLTEPCKSSDLPSNSSLILMDTNGDYPKIGKIVRHPPESLLRKVRLCLMQA